MRLVLPFSAGGPTDADARMIAAFGPVNSVLAHVRGGRLRGVAITSRERAPLLPDVMTIDESVLPRLRGRHVRCRAAARPAGLPAEQISRLNQALTSTLQEPSFRSQLESQGLRLLGGPRAMPQLRARQPGALEAGGRDDEPAHRVALGPRCPSGRELFLPSRAWALGTLIGPATPQRCTKVLPPQAVHTVSPARVRGLESGGREGPCAPSARCRNPRSVELMAPARSRPGNPVAEAIGASRVGIRLSPYGVFNDMPPYAEMDADYTYLGEQLGKLGLAWLHIVDHSAMGAPEVPQRIKKVLREAFHGPIILTGGYDPQRAHADLDAGKAELIGVGHAFLANPDLPRRWRENLPLNEPDMGSFYTPGEKGYADYTALAT